MLILNGEKWEIIPYIAEFKVTQPTMTKEGYPPDTIFTENKLTSEQQAKLDELNELVDKNISVEEATEFVFNPEPTDNRTSEEKLIEIILDLDPTKVEDETIQNNIRDWKPDTAYDRFIFVRYNGVVYKTVHPIRTFRAGTPPERPELYSRVGGKDEETGLEEIVPDVNGINSYPKDFVGHYEGHVYKSNYDNNIDKPYVGSQHPSWWTDLGTVEDYLASKGGE